MSSWSRASPGQRIGPRALRPQPRLDDSVPPLGTCVPALRARRPPQARCRPQGLQGFAAAFPIYPIPVIVTRMEILAIYELELNRHWLTVWISPRMSTGN